jgi:peptidyl-prolyl cis-trans isomerase SurA
MNKKSLLIVVIMILLPLAGLFANTLNQPAATVNLIRNKIITVNELKERVAAYEAEALASGVTASISPSEMLEVLINDEVVLQGAERDGYFVTDTQVDQLIKQQKTYVESQVGREITQEQFESVVRSNYGYGLSEFREKLKETALVDLYVRGKMGSVIENYAAPTDSEINEFFRKNRSSFMNPELVRLSHIFMPFESEGMSKAETKQEMEKLARWLRYNTYTFEELVPRYSKDTDSRNRGGDIGWLAYDDAQMRSALGASFFDEVFTLALGKPSGVLESTSGYHIVKLTIHTEPKLLGIDDFINPESTMTVRQYIRQTLESRNQQNAYLTAIDRLVEQLRNSAKIEILYKEGL